MLETDISKVSLSHLSAIGLRSDDKPKSYKYSHTVKNALIDTSGFREIEFLGSNFIQIRILASDYLQALFNDLHFGNKRIVEQCKNLEYLLGSNAQPAWVLVTAYYAAYFIVNDISKANGRFVMNFNKEEFLGILSTQPLSLQNAIAVEENNPFFVVIEHSDMSGEILVKLNKSSPKPHKIAWSNFSQIINKIKIEDARLAYLSLLREIVSSEGSSWGTPSAVRNIWNYSNSNYYSEKGNDIGKVFSSIIKSSSSTFRWAMNNNLKPTQENMAASIAYVYYTLKLSHKLIIERLKIE